jgi:hypothetical protein
MLAKFITQKKIARDSQSAHMHSSQSFSVFKGSKPFSLTSFQASVSFPNTSKTFLVDVKALEAKFSKMHVSIFNPNPAPQITKKEFQSAFVNLANYQIVKIKIDLVNKIQDDLVSITKDIQRLKTSKEKEYSEITNRISLMKPLIEAFKELIDVSIVETKAPLNKEDKEQLKNSTEIMTKYYFQQIENLSNQVKQMENENKSPAMYL